MKITLRFNQKLVFHSFSKHLVILLVILVPSSHLGSLCQHLLGAYSMPNTTLGVLYVLLHFIFTATP